MVWQAEPVTLQRIESERLVLRPLTFEDLDELLPFHSDPEVVRFIPWPVRDRDQVIEWLHKAVEFTDLANEGDYLALAIVRKDSGQVIGQVNAMYRSTLNQTAEIGYVINPQFGSQGFASEAAIALVDALFDSGKFRRVIARLDARNDASVRLLERIGFRREAHHIEDDFFKDEWTSTYIYAVLKSEWESLRSLR